MKNNDYLYVKAPTWGLGICGIVIPYDFEKIPDMHLNNKYIQQNSNGSFNFYRNCKWSLNYQFCIFLLFFFSTS